MFNALNKKVTCDSCGASIPVEALSVRVAKRLVAKEGWVYAGMGEFGCPKCQGKKK